MTSEVPDLLQLLEQEYKRELAKRRCELTSRKPYEEVLDHEIEHHLPNISMHGEVNLFIDFCRQYLNQNRPSAVSHEAAFNYVITLGNHRSFLISPSAESGDTGVEYRAIQFGAKPRQDVIDDTKNAEAPAVPFGPASRR